MSEHIRVSRRRLLGSMGALAGLGMTNAAAGFDPARAPTSRGATPTGSDTPRVLALVGDRYHNSDYIRTALTRLFRELDLPILFTINFSEIDAAHLARCRLLVVFRDGLNWPNGYLEPDDYAYSSYLENSAEWPKEEYQGWITEEQGKAIKEFVEAGGSLYAYHNSSNVSVFSKNFREVMGGAYLGHPPLRPFKVKVVNHEHPLTQGIHDFIVNDEQHYMTYDKNPKDILLRSENIDGLEFDTYGATAISAWAYDYGKGRVVFTAVGHTLHALWQPEYYKIQKNAVRWLLKMS
ncbi:MAG: ThuA domain-containing protein [Terriglobia bacterium]